MRADDRAASGRPVLTGPTVILRPGRAGDGERLHAILSEPSVSQWWGTRIRCYAKVGFRPVGVLRAYERGPDGRFHDGLLMDMLATELRCGT